MSKHLFKLLVGAATGCGAAFVPPAFGADEPMAEVEELSATEVLGDSLAVIPTAPVGAVFGLGKTIYETPRSVSTVSAEMIERFSVDDVNDVVTFAPGAFTTSFFGVPGQLDIRGAPGETYFRGMKRIENPGNYPTPIGASDRIEIVRGPASPIYGPGKIGGYLNFVPKSARASTGKYLSKPAGQFSVTLGSFDKRKTTFEVGGPTEIFGKKAGYYAFIQLENSGSFYQNSYLDQTILQGTFDVELTDALRVETGVQYQYSGFTENAGWNRVTQKLIDEGIYLAGSLQVQLDTDNSGFVDQAEVRAGNNGSYLGFFVPAFSGSAGITPAAFRLDPATVREVKISPRNVLIDERDRGNSDSAAFFFDLINDKNTDLTFTNKVLVDVLMRSKAASYGFSQYNYAFSLEDKFVVEQRGRVGEWLKFNNAYALSARWYDADDRADFTIEYFDRRDLTVGPTPNDRMGASLDNAGKNPWGRSEQAEYKDLSLSVITDSQLFGWLDVTLGGRLGNIHLEAESDVGSLGYIPGVAKNSDTNFAYTASLGAQITKNLRIYGTNSKQPLLTTNQTGGVAMSIVASRPFANAKLSEAGVKGSFLDNRLYVAFAGYEQQLSSYNSQTGTITATKGRGFEIEGRWVASKSLTFMAAMNWQKTVYNPLVSSNAAFQFAYPALSGIPAAESYGGTIQTSLATAPGGLADYEERSGIPDRTISLSGVYTFGKGFGVTVSSSFVPEVSADRAKLITLPSYVLVNSSLFYDGESWAGKIAIGNLLDETYFRANFPEIFGGVTVIPQPWRNFEATLTYKF